MDTLTTAPDNTTATSIAPKKRHRHTPEERATIAQRKAARAERRKTLRISQFLRAALRTGDRANDLYAKKREFIADAQKAGLGLNQPIEVNGEKFVLVKPDGKWVHFSELDLKKLPKNPRTPKAEPQPAPTAEAAL